MNKQKDFKSLVAEVKLAYNIVDYIQQSGVQLKQKGMKYSGLCPFHNEKTSSFYVDENYQNYKCFGCGAAGDLLNFVQKQENLDFFEALKKLAEDKGIEVDIEGTEGSSIDYKSLRACMKATANFFYNEFNKLDENHVAKKEITERGLSVKNKMLYGYAPEGRKTLFNFLKEQGFSEETIVTTGVCKKSEKGIFYDFWQGRLMFFITDITGKPIGFSGRKLYETDNRGKYVNSSDTPLFDKGASLYHIDGAKKTASDEKEMFVVEGQFDVSAFVEAGVKNVVASSGTAFTEKQGMIIRRLVTESGRIVFAFDGDTAGVAAAVKVFKNVPGIHDQSYVVSLPENQDPCDYRLEHGSEKLVEYVNKNAKPMIEFILEATSEDYDLDSTLGRSRYVDAACKVLKTISSASLRDVFIKKVSLDSFTSVESIREVLSKAEPIEIYSSKVNEEDKKEDENERPKFDEGTEVDQNSIIQQIQTDAVYNVAARFISLSFMQRKFIPHLIKSHDLIPTNMQSIIEDLKTLDYNEKIVPEQFELSQVISNIFATNFFPLAHLMTPSIQKEQFIYLHRYLRSREATISKNKVRSKISRILEQSNNNDVYFLEKALAKEQYEIEKIFNKVIDAEDITSE